MKPFMRFYACSVVDSDLSEIAYPRLALAPGIRDLPGYFRDYLIFLPRSSRSGISSYGSDALVSFPTAFPSHNQTPKC